MSLFEKLLGNAATIEPAVVQEELALVLTNGER